MFQNAIYYIEIRSGIFQYVSGYNPIGLFKPF